MGLIAHYRNKADTWYWRARYWWMDTTAGAEAHAVAFVLSVLVLVYQIAKMAFVGLMPQPQGAPQQSIVWWVVQLIIAVVSAILSYALRPKPPKTPDPKIQGPQVEDGITVDNYYGTHWHEDEAMPAWDVVGKKKIKQKGGKK